MALTAATRSSSESIRVPSRSKRMSLMVLTGSGRSVRIIAFQYSHAAGSRRDHPRPRFYNWFQEQGIIFLERNNWACGEIASSRTTPIASTTTQDLLHMFWMGYVLFVAARPQPSKFGHSQEVGSLVLVETGLGNLTF